MKSRQVAVIVAALVAGGLALGAQEQRQRGGPPGPLRDGQRPRPPIVSALDANHDGAIDEREIANAAAALKTLDKNGDGTLTEDELRPPRPEGREPGGPDGRGPDGDRRPPLPPVISALDANHDGLVDAKELGNALAALKTLDKNRDGELSMDEMLPPRPDGPRGGQGREQ